MKKQIMTTMLAAALLAPTVRLWADEGKESAKEEKTESREKQHSEEQEAMMHYQKAVSKYGESSSQAKKAWKHVIAEYKEHGDTPPSSITPPPSKS